MLQPLLASFRAVRQEELESARLLGAGRWQRMRHVILPSCRSGLLSAACLGFAHTVGEFGVVLMIGGNIDGETRVISIALYNQVEQANYGAAHQLALMLLLFSLAALSAVYWLTPDRNNPNDIRPRRGRHTGDIHHAQIRAARRTRPVQRQPGAG